jgi:hypothetical protein
VGLAPLAMLSLACDVEDVEDVEDVDEAREEADDEAADDDEADDEADDDDAFRDLSVPYRGVPVLIQNLAHGTCLSVDAPSNPYPFEVACNPADSDQQFVFQVKTYVGGLGFVYEVCSVNAPTYCLMHVNNGTVFFDPGAGQSGFSYDQVRIQHDEEQAFIEFRHSGKCLTKGPTYPTPVATTCSWFGATPQRYRLYLASEGSCAGSCGDYDPAQACQCDDACSGYGDCCVDHTSQCGA